MKVYHSLEHFSAKNPVVTIGMFDGVHAGHRSILTRLEDIKKRIDGESVLLTFWPHPQVFFGKTDGFKMLSTLNEKLELLAQTGLDNCIIFPFTHEFSQISPESYINDILHNGIGAKTVVIGYDHRYGKNGAGHYDLMQEFGKKLGFEVEEIPAFELEHVNVSSTKVRHALLEGDILKAKTFLTYNYSIQGNVALGKQIGRTIGIPTANIIPDSDFKIIPALGVYVARVLYNNKLHDAVLSVGLNPTIDPLNAIPTIEVHILDFNEDVYHKTLRVYFMDRIRDEKKYPSLEALKQGIADDILYARKFFSEAT
jgi:riboflavin kinase/FMN adenylyltransferase